MNIKEHKALLEKALCTLEILEQARTVRHRLYEWIKIFGCGMDTSTRHTEDRIKLFEDKVIPRLEIRYREQLYKATQI